MAKKNTDKAKKEPAAVPQRVTGPRSLQLVPGFRDRLGPEQQWWGFFQKVAFEVMEKYNYLLVHPSAVEYTTAFTRTLGKDHVLVEDNLFTLLDPRHEHISLRPTLDVSFLRAYHNSHKQDFELGIPIEHWYTIGSVFGEKLDQREHFGLFMTVIANNHPVVDAECTVAAVRYLEALGFDQIQVMVNSVGGQQSQTAYKQELVAYYKDHKKDIPEKYHSDIVKNPYRILTATNDERLKDINLEAPQCVDWLVDADKEHFMRVLEYLDELEMPYMLSPELVPMNEYRHQTIVSVKVTTETGTEYVLASGGRADGLGEDMLDMNIPMMNMSIDLDKCLSAVRTAKMEIPEKRVPQIFMAQLGDAAKKRALSLREEVHAAGISTSEHYGQDSLKKQLEEAVELKVKYTCILGQKEILDGTILIRDMEGGIQEEVPLDKLVSELKKRL
jgi:histidyl-tRNA synthetase